MRLSSASSTRKAGQWPRLNGGGATGGGAAGEAAADLLTALIEDGGVLLPATPESFAVLVERLVAQETVRATGAAHPRHLPSPDPAVDGIPVCRD